MGPVVTGAGIGIMIVAGLFFNLTALIVGAILFLIGLCCA